MENLRIVAVRYGAVVQVLLLLFVLRVAGQFIQVWTPVGYLPALDQWQGSGISYPWLLFVQVVILVLVALLAVRLKRGRVMPHRKLGNALLIAGVVYFGVMLARLLLGLTLLSDHYWFNRYIPAFFHLVLAGIVLTLGDYHRRYSKAS
jgi:hypothetical protein